MLDEAIVFQSKDFTVGNKSEDDARIERGGKKKLSYSQQEVLHAYPQLQSDISYLRAFLCLQPFQM
jgi:hypothetical protein